MAEAPESLIGITVGDYKITGIIGQGGMGVVYTAEHTTLHHKTACKVLRAEMANHPETVERFLQEARLISRIRHMNLIDIFDIGELPDKRLYYVMEYLNGRTLAEAVKGQRMPFADIVAIMNQICAGLGAAHAAGLIHRDLKPDNLFLVERPGEPPLIKVMDFGVAKVQDLGSTDAKLTRTGYLVGTPQYMSPEQINGVDVDKRSDIYALGVILYEMCTGTPPFRGETLGQMLIAHLQQILPTIDPKALAADVPPEIEMVIRKALAKDPGERYPDVASLAADLGRLTAGQPTEAAGWYKAYKPREITAIQTLHGATLNLPLSPESKRRRMMLLGATLLPGVLLCAVGGYFVLKHRNPPPPEPVKVKRQPPPRKREEIDMLALRAYALGVLQEGLKDPDVQPRLLALQALAASRDTRHRPLFEQRLEDADPTVQAQAATALAQLGTPAAVPPLLKLAEAAQDAKVSLAAAEALARLGEPTGRKLLEKQAKAKKAADPRAPLLAALALEDLDPNHAPQKLVKQRLEKSKEEDEVLLILTRRAKRGDAAAESALVEKMKDEAAPPGRKLQLAALLAKQQSEPGKTLLSQVAAQPGPQQVLAAQLLCGADDPTGLPLLRSAFDDGARPPYERLLAAEGLGACGTRKDASNLAKVLKAGERSPLLRQAEGGAILRLASGDPAVLAEQSLTWAQAALSDDNWAVRESAVAMLGDIDPQRAVPLLGKAIKDQREEVRKSAAVALGRTQDRGAIAVLGGAITDASKVVRLDVLRSIGKVSQGLRKKGEAPIDAGTQAQIQQALTKSADTGDPAEQVVAAATLLRMGDESRKDKLKQALGADDPELKQLAIEEAAADPELEKNSMTTLLGDKVFAVRFRAACSLAEQGRKEGVAVLREALKSGGLDGFKAYGLLKKLGEEAAPPSDLATVVQSGDAAARAGVVEAAASLPVKDAVPVLKQAVKDSSATVRGKVLDVIAGWSPADGSTAGLPIVKGLSEDFDPLVRSRAGLLLSKLLPKPAPEPEEPAAPEGEPAAKGATAEPAAVADLGASPDLTQAAVVDQGTTGTAVPDLQPARDLGATPVAPDLATPPAPVAPAVPVAAKPEAPAPGAAKPDAAKPDAAKPDAAKPDAPLSPAEEKVRVKQAMDAAERFLSRGDYAKATQALEAVQASAPSKGLFMTLGQAYQLWAEQESGAKQKTLVKKAIEAYKKAKTPAAKQQITELQQMLQ